MAKSSDSMRWFESPENEAGLRFVGAAHDIAKSNYSYLSGIDHTGWFTDPHQMETIHGVVYQLPGKCGRARYVAGYNDACNDGAACLDLSTIFEGAKDGEHPSYYDGAPASYDPGARDAAFCADSLAEHAAERERDYQTAWAAGSLFADLGEQIAETRRELLAILEERKHASPATYPAICAALRRTVRNGLADIAKWREQRAKLQAGDYDEMLFWPGDSELAAAFKDGAGL